MAMVEQTPQRLSPEQAFGAISSIKAAVGNAPDAERKLLRQRGVQFIRGTGINGPLLAETLEIWNAHDTSHPAATGLEFTNVRTRARIGGGQVEIKEQVIVQIDHATGEINAGYRNFLLLPNKKIQSYQTTDPEEVLQRTERLVQRLVRSTERLNERRELEGGLADEIDTSAGLSFHDPDSDFWRRQAA